MPGFSSTRRRVAGAAGGLVLAAGLGGVAQAKHKGSIMPVTESHAGAQMLARTMMVDSRQLINARFAALPPDSHPNAISTEPLAGFPRRGKAYAILTNGCARLADQHKSAGQPGCRDNGLEFRGVRDLTILRLQVRVPSNKNCLSFRFRFLSQEYPTYVNQQYNDGFIAEMDVSNWSSLPNSPTIVAPRDFAVGPAGQVIRVNNTGPAELTAANAKGTTYGGATPILRASTPVTPGRHFLYLSIFDQGDRQYDSAAFIDNLTINHVTSCKSGLVHTK